MNQLPGHLCKLADHFNIDSGWGEGNCDSNGCRAAGQEIGSNVGMFVSELLLKDNRELDGKHGC